MLRLFFSFLIALVFSVDARAESIIKVVINGQEMELDESAAKSFDYDDSAHPMRLYVRDQSNLVGVDGKEIPPGTLALTWSESFKATFRKNSRPYNPARLDVVAFKFGGEKILIDASHLSKIRYADLGEGKPLKIVVPASVNFVDSKQQPIATREGETYRTNEVFKAQFKLVAKPLEEGTLVVPAVAPRATLVDEVEPPQAIPVEHDDETPAPPIVVGPNVRVNKDFYEAFNYTRTVKLKNVHGFNEDSEYWVKGEDAVNGMYFLQEIPNGKLQSLPRSIAINKVHMVPYEHMSRVTVSLKTKDHEIAPGTVIKEVDHSSSQVRFKIVGDPTETLFSVSREAYLKSVKSDIDMKRAQAQAKRLGGSVTPGFDEYTVTALGGALSLPSSLSDETKSDPRTSVAAGEVIEILGEGAGADKNMYIARRKGHPETIFYIPEDQLTDSQMFQSRQAQLSDATLESSGHVTNLNPAKRSAIDESFDETTQTYHHRNSRAKTGFLGDASAFTLSSPPCQPFSNYSPKQLSSWASTRKYYRSAIIAAANEHSIDPAILETSIQIETDFGDNVENETEIEEIIAQLKAEEVQKKLANPKYQKQVITRASAKAYAIANNLEQWGRGPAQIGPACAKRLGLEWDVDKPEPFPPVPESYRAAHPNSVYIPEVALDAQAQLFKEEMQKARSFTDSKGKTWDLRKQLFGRGSAETARNLLAMWNRGEPRVMDSYRAYIEKNRKMPDHFGQVWSARPYMQYDRVLYGQKINRRHVYYVAGLCGDADRDSLLARFSREYGYDNGKWTTAVNSKGAR
ncbi:MAG TPA: hypothetical protein VM901_09670 [Bdellovibrionota bacterium]|jgi:hypothetical protein|nr:hypothetical protein [Bdellovibrionota bacterium]